MAERTPTAKADLRSFAGGLDDDLAVADGGGSRGGRFGGSEENREQRDRPAQSLRNRHGVAPPVTPERMWLATKPE